MTEIRADHIQRTVLRSDTAQVAILSLGCITQDWQVAWNGSTYRTVLGYDRLADYLTSPYYLGAIAGRVANRIGNGQFELDGKRVSLEQNAPPHTLHGGRVGLGRRIWKMEQDGDRAVQLSYRSPNGEDGFPGAVDFEVIISLTGPTLNYEMRAWPDRPTPINLAQHSYYMLGETSVDDLCLTLLAEGYTEVDATGLPTGKIKTVDGTDWDFRSGQRLAIADRSHRGIDHNFTLPNTGGHIELVAPSGLRLQMKTDQPGIQIYTASHLGTHGNPLAGQVHAPFSAICLEPQNYPDAVNQSHFPDPIFGPDRPYAQSLSVSIEGTT